mgnify:CR=1 FL=1
MPSITLPLAKGTDAVSLGEGYTPILHGRVAGAPVYLKQDHLFPSGSFKDRGAAVLVSHAAALGIKRVVEDSSGNAGAAIAAFPPFATATCAEGNRETPASSQTGQRTWPPACCPSNASPEANQPSKRCPRVQVRSKMIMSGERYTGAAR